MQCIQSSILFYQLIRLPSNAGIVSKQMGISSHFLTIWYGIILVF